MLGDHRTNLGNDGNGIPFNEHDRRRGADPPKNVSGSTGIELSVESSKKSVKTRKLLVQHSDRCFGPSIDDVDHGCAITAFEGRNKVFHAILIHYLKPV
jgi:hypothetical protein